MFLTMNLRKKLSTKHFILSQFFILLTGLVILVGFYYILNIQYGKTDRPFLNGPVTTMPKSLLLTLDQPDDNLLIFQSSILVSGKTGPLKDVLIFTDSWDLVIESKKDGSFSTVVILNEGVNKITAVTLDERGDSRSTERIVYYSKEKL